MADSDMSMVKVLHEYKLFLCYKMSKVSVNIEDVIMHKVPKA